MKMYEVTRAIYALSLEDALRATGEVINAVYRGESPFEASAVDAAPALDKPTKAQIKASITDDALISFEDGKPYKMLKRSLSLRGMTMAYYREKWGLPDDYPSVAPAYSARRSELAKANGLGRKR